MFGLRRNQRRRCDAWICYEQIVGGGSASGVEDIARLHAGAGTIAGNRTASSSVPVTGRATVRPDFAGDVAVKQHSTARAGILVPDIDCRVARPEHWVRYQYVIAVGRLVRSIGNPYAALSGVADHIVGEGSRVCRIVHHQSTPRYAVAAHYVVIGRTEPCAVIKVNGIFLIFGV